MSGANRSTVLCVCFRETKYIWSAELDKPASCCDRADVLVKMFNTRSSAS